MARRWLEDIPQDSLAPLYRATVRSVGVDPLRERPDAPRSPLRPRGVLSGPPSQEPRAAGRGADPA